MIRTVINTCIGRMTANGKTAGFYKSIAAGYKSEINAVLDHKKLPLVALVAPIVFKIRMNQSGYKPRTYPIQLWIIYKSEPTWTDAEHDQKAIQLAQLAADNLLNILEKHEQVESVKPDVDGIEFTNQFDCNTSGVIINLTVTLRNTNSICTE